MTKKNNGPLWKKLHKIRKSHEIQTKSPGSPAAIPVPGDVPAVHMSCDEIFKIATRHNEYSMSDVTPKLIIRKGIYNLEDVTEYGVSEEKEKIAWKSEIERLVEAVENVDKPLVFCGKNLLEQETAESYAYFAKMSDLIWVAVNVCIHDSQVLLQKHCPGLYMDSFLQRSRIALSHYIREENGDDSDDSDEETEVEGEQEGMAPAAYEDAFALINYLTAIMARVLFKSASGHEWHQEIIAILAKVATKLKVVAHEPKKIAAASLESFSNDRMPIHVSGMRTMAERGNAAGPMDGDGGLNVVGPGQLMARDPRDELDKLVNFMNLLGDNRKNEIIGPKSLYNTARKRYWADSTKIQVYVLDISRHVLISLRGQDAFKTAMATSFEICTMIYENGLDEYASNIFQDIDGEYLGQSKTENLSVMNGALEVVNLAISNLSKFEAEAHRRNTTAPSPTAQAPAVNVGAFVSYYFKTAKSGTATDNWEIAPKKKYLHSMNAVATIIIPILLTNPVIIKTTTDMIGVCIQAIMAPNQIRLYQANKTKASFCLSTKEYQDNWQKSHPKSVKSLSQSPLARDGLFAWYSGYGMPMRIPTVLSPSPNEDLLPIALAKTDGVAERKFVQEGYDRLRQASAIMDDWIVEESGVRVRCKRYVGSVMAIAAALVGCGITAGVTVGNRLTGVDPFGITTFCWVIATFVFLIAKSIRVAEWPWHDFMRFQVLCRSVSELSSVTGIDRQLILAKLLLEESNTVLQTRGPYNCVFKRCLNTSDGFSIDEPISLGTLLLSGLIMVQVRAPYHGEFLVCLELRRGTSYSVILQSMSDDDGSFIVSSPLTNDEKKGDKQQIQLYQTKYAAWTSILGIYTDENSYFV